MNENKQNTTLLTVIAVATLLVAVVGSTFAYFTASMGNTSTSNISTKSGKMVITFADGSNGITLTDIFKDGKVQPGNEVLVDKTFTLTGNNTATAAGGINMPFNVGLRYKNGFTAVSADAENTGVDGVAGQGGLVYWIRYVEKDGAKVESVEGVAGQKYTGQATEDLKTYYRGVIPQNTAANDAYLHLAKGYFPPIENDDSSIEFNLKITFPDTGVEQDNNKTKSFSGKIVVNDSDDTNSVNVSGPTTTTKATTGA